MHRKKITYEVFRAPQLLWSRNNVLLTQLVSANNSAEQAESQMLEYLQTLTRWKVRRWKDLAVVAFDGSTVLGWSLVQHAGAGDSYPTDLQVYVLPKRRRRGIGSHLVKLSLDKWGAKGLIRTSPWNRAGLQFYTALSEAHPVLWVEYVEDL